MDQSDISDEAIVRAVIAGEPERFGVLILRYEAKLKRYAHKFLQDNDTVEDLVQDSFVKAYTNLRSFDTTMRFSPWLYRIAHNTFANELRRRSRYGFNFFDIDTILPVLSTKDSADAVSLQAETGLLLDQTLRLLPAKYREILILHYYEELSYQEMSDVLAVSVSTVGVRLNRARAKMEVLIKQKI